MTTKSHPYPTRIKCTFRGKSGHGVLDQIRTVDQSRLVRKLGVLDEDTAAKVLEGLIEEGISAPIDAVLANDTVPSFASATALAA